MDVGNLDKWKLGMVGMRTSERTGETRFFRIHSIDRANGLLGHTPITKDEYLEAVKEGD